MEVGLHPLVILNIADHYTHVHLNPPHESRVIGALFGKFSDEDRTVHVLNSFELVYKVELDEQKNNFLQVDEDDLISRTELCN